MTCKPAKMPCKKSCKVSGKRSFLHTVPRAKRRLLTRTFAKVRRPTVVTRLQLPSTFSQIWRVSRETNRRLTCFTAVFPRPPPSRRCFERVSRETTRFFALVFQFFHVSRETIACLTLNVPNGDTCALHPLNFY